ncbi:MAG: 4-(cytidine 5-diphospho)-2-C-methyl-D-erythritol kinase [Actinomycetota bacterium]|nr:4-(cytidine 5-diphospho)-2-C-methyl-D-erythritol kinase [Actinomycetota bacterium]
MTTPTVVTVRAPAKINLELVVGAPRPDGFHDLATVFHAVSLIDEVSAEPSDDITVTVEGTQADQVPCDETNLAVRAARLLARHTRTVTGARLHIRKGIPVAGGMAGGSADAAAALLACDTLWDTGLSRQELLHLGAQLGSDVPFALVGGTAVGTGRGERLTEVPAVGDHQWVVALAGRGLSTPAVYEELDRLRAGEFLSAPRVSDQLLKALRAGDPVLLGSRLANDLEAAACSLAPELEITLKIGRACGALGGIVSGSGPTVVFLVRDAEHAFDLTASLTACGSVRDVRRAHGPVHGAEIVEHART